LSTFVKLFRHHPSPSREHELKHPDVIVPIDEQINYFARNWMEEDGARRLDIKQITYIPFHMSLTVEALVLFESSIIPAKNDQWVDERS